MSLRDAAGAPPSFGVKVVELRKVRVFVVPLVAKSSHAAPMLNTEVWTDVSNVYAQCGVSFQIEEKPLSIWPGVLAVSPLNKDTWPSAIDIASYNEGLVVYVVDELKNGACAFSYGCGERELVVSSSSSGVDLAHEIGHAFGLNDIYSNSHENIFGKKNLVVTATDYIQQSHFASEFDRNGGAGTRYYSSECFRMSLIFRLLMYGVYSDVSLDVPLGKVKGVCSEGLNAASFSDTMSEVGLSGIVVQDSIIVEE